MQNHNHKACVHSALKSAEALCELSGVKLTPIRKRVLELVWKNHKAVKAYELLEQLSANDGAQAPPTIYRALEFLQGQGLVHKVECLNAFIGCAHPESKHGCQFFICKNCEDVREYCDAAITKRLNDNAQKRGFELQRPILEVLGLCAECKVSA